jgi:hypothetical protein
VVFALLNRWNTARPSPLGSQATAHAETHPHSPHLVEDYQIAFFCDNFFLLGATDEITLAGLPHSERPFGTR